jgi:two-component system response regulator
VTYERTILLVEDNLDDADLTLRAFRRAGTDHPIHVVADGSEALDWLSERVRGSGILPAVVLLDLRMPRIDGFEVLRRIRADDRTRPLPVIILTSSTEEGDLLKGYGLGANSYVRKSVDFAQFLEIARDVDRYWLGWNELPWALSGSDRQG